MWLTVSLNTTVYDAFVTLYKLPLQHVRSSVSTFLIIIIILIIVIISLCITARHILFCFVLYWVVLKDVCSMLITTIHI